MWDDYEVFLAMAREGATTGAGRRLGINPTTCARRITALEETFGASLFERHASGYRLLPLGERLVPMAEAMERQVAAIRETVQAHARKAAVTIRMTIGDSMLELFVSPALAAFRELYPGVNVGFTIDNRHADVAGDEADFAIRTGPAPTDPLLVARKLAQVAFAVYAGKGYVDRHGAPASLAEMANHAVVASTLDERPYGGAVPESAILMKGNSAQGIAQMIAGDMAVGGLPCIIGDADPNLVRCFDLDTASFIWATYPERLRHEPHVRALSDCVATHLTTLRPQLAGIRA